MSNRFTPAAENALNQSLYLARALGHTYIGTEHILLGLLSEKDGVAARILSLRGITYDKTHAALLTLVGSGIPTRISPDDMTPRARAVIEHAAYRAMKAGQSHIGTEHLLLGLTEEEDCCAIRLLCAQRVTPREIQLDTDRYLRDLSGTGGSGKESKGPARSEEKEKGTPALRQYTRDLCAMAAKGELDPLIGREEELAHLIRILCRRGKNNPCLIGEPGVGKTAMAEGLACAIASGQVPEPLRTRRILSLDIPAMIAGAKYRGEFEERMKNVMNEARVHREIVLFIDEIHTIVGAGSAEGAVDAANILKPALARGEIQVIGATTIEEYRKHIEKDGALERRFQPLLLAEPTPEQTLTILRGLRPTLEAHHGITIPDPVLERAVALSVRYWNDRFLPDKAIDLLDEGGAALRLQEQAKEPAPQDALFRFREQQAMTEKAPDRVLTEAVLERLITEQTGIPVHRSEEEEERLRTLEDLLSQRVIGQPEAVRTVAHAIRRSRCGIAPSNRPSASFLFLGPSGVGKTELARTLATVLFGSERALIRFDMSEYMEKHSLSRLIGSPPGYVGHEEGGQLLRVRRQPYSVLLFDEIEKAHPDLCNLFLQILEEGEATDASGRRISFRSCILIFTSNLTPHIGAISGFGQRSKTASAGERERLFASLKQHFRPELLGRIEDIVLFSRLQKEELTAIAALELKRLTERAARLRITLQWEDGFPESLATEALGAEEGARVVRRLVRERAEQTLAEAILRKEVKEGEQLRLTMGEWKLENANR